MRGWSLKRRSAPDLSISCHRWYGVHTTPGGGRARAQAAGQASHSGLPVRGDAGAGQAGVRSHAARLTGTSNTNPSRQARETNAGQASKHSTPLEPSERRSPTPSTTGPARTTKQPAPARVGPRLTRSTTTTRARLSTHIDTSHRRGSPRWSDHSETGWTTKTERMRQDVSGWSKWSGWSQGYCERRVG